MRTISAKAVRDAVSKLCVKANFDLRSDVRERLRAALRIETNKNARYVLAAIIRNAQIAHEEKLAICQDTGLPVVFIEIGQEVRIAGDFKKALLQGIASGYRWGNLRESIANNPLVRAKSGYKGAVIHTDIVKGDKLKITVLPKGFGCENKSKLKMFNPTVPLDETKQFIVETVKNAGSDACPPYVIGVGIGGTADYAMLLAKKALLRKIKGHKVTKSQGHQLQAAGRIKKLEQELLREINRLGIGPMGMGGKTSCLGVNIATYPTHIAGLPVAVNISCHALRSATTQL